MTKTKILLSGLAILTTALGFVQWAQIGFDPLYSDARFQPSDKLHAWCIHSADITLNPQWQTITTLSAMISYDPEQIEILRILPMTDIVSTSKIEYNKIILQSKNPKNSTTKYPLFQIFFKSTVPGESLLKLETGSQVTTKNNAYPLAGTFPIAFEKVPECEPDIIPPNINLVSPKNTDQNITLDQYFIFDVKDIGKWVSKESAVINFMGKQYYYWSENIKWNANYLMFYPDQWLPINQDVSINVLVADKQSYGWANTSQKIFTFHTATGMILKNNVTPILFRKIAQEAGKISASVDECEVLGNFYASADILYQKKLRGILQKFWCDLEWIENTLTTPVAEKPTMNKSSQQYNHISVFATLGWILFFIAFSLKIHYLLQYKKHKRLSQQK